jgi:hypothetical protein
MPPVGVEHTISAGERPQAAHLLLVVVWPVNRQDHDQQHCYHHAPTVKPEAVNAVVELLMMGVKAPETC